MNWNSQKVWITGATAGLGKSLAEDLASKGASLVVCGRNPTAVGRLMDQLPKTADQEHVALIFDLAEDQDYSKLVAEAEDKIGTIDILVHNAGVSQKGYFENTSPEVEEKIWRVNYLSTVALTRAILPRMKEQGSGQIVVVGSIAGRYGAPYLSTYSASKHALYGFYESLRYEVESFGVNILMVTPGFIRTDIALKALNEKGEATMQDSKAQANGVSPERAAQKMVRAMSKKKNSTLYIGKLELLFLPISKLSPRLFYWLIKKLHGL